MGLDMYLTAERYASNYRNPELAADIRNACKDAPPPCGNLNSTTVSFEAAYWRKANAIHAWFVREVQDGTDECQRSMVPGEKLEELRDICSRLLHSRDNEEADRLLPTQDGFFFGDTEYDEWYWSNIAETEERLTLLLAWHKGKERDWDFYYQASW